MSTTSRNSVVTGAKELRTKTRNVTIADTTARQIATLPKGSRILAFLINGVASDAVTTATLSFGSTTTATEFVNGQDVKTAALGVGPTLAKGVSGVLGAVLTVDTPVYALYAETGGAAAVGSWKVSIIYTTGNVVFDDTI